MMSSKVVITEKKWRSINRKLELAEFEAWFWRNRCESLMDQQGGASSLQWQSTDAPAPIDPVDDQADYDVDLEEAMDRAEAKMAHLQKLMDKLELKINDPDDMVADQDDEGESPELPNWQDEPVSDGEAPQEVNYYGPNDLEGALAKVDEEIEALDKQLKYYKSSPLPDEAE